MIDYRLSVAGLVVGTLVGLTGVGGSSVLAPILILLLGIKPMIAVGTDLLYSVPTKLLAFGLHARRGTVDWRITGLLLLGGIPGALLGLGALAYARAHVDEPSLETIVRHAIGVAILCAAASALATRFIFRGAANAAAAADDRATIDVRRPVILAIGALVGFLVAATSIGSGSLTLPLLLFALPAVSLRRLIGSEIAFAAMLVPLAAAGHVSLGTVDARVTFALLLGSLPGVALGSWLVRRVEDGALRYVVAGVLAFAGLRLI